MLLNWVPIPSTFPFLCQNPQSRSHQCIDPRPGYPALSFFAPTRPNRDDPFNGRLNEFVGTCGHTKRLFPVSARPSGSIRRPRDRRRTPALRPNDLTSKCRMWESRGLGDRGALVPEVRRPRCGASRRRRPEAWVPFSRAPSALPSSVRLWFRTLFPRLPSLETN
jgi:hypothetical protein